ncbi:amino acid adenylation domain-containing protein [Mycolicibacterium sp. 120270]|uniref:non-ribosomal peptide synthetase n=1 Tax=Mycolicibacterium sp. 120270 TaxID=3090600 RepID=UPI00299DC817|nr:amino acid adenylation domain-containing protein [Mycolicibacterium sp. 120270]MDX1882822.1 amino acid adenylation domain-containing protein [Mycolicibacterium sp. 120270]
MGDASTQLANVRDEVAELLGVAPEDLDPDADLIATGLDSIRMMSLSGRWRRQGIDVGFAALAEKPTVRAWTELIGDSASPDAASPPAQPVGDDDPGAPFPLAPIQHAMWVGRQEDQQLGGVSSHLYVELDGADVDPERLRVAAAKLAARHPMLRVDILSDGTQRIGERSLGVSVHDLRNLTSDDAHRRLERIRDEKSHQQLNRQVLEISLSLLPGGATRLHVDLDMQAADAISYRNLMADLAALYQGVDLPALAYTYREYRARLTASTPPPAAEDVAWWAERIPDLPEPPALPLIPLSEQDDPLRSVRLWHVFDVPTRNALFAAAHRRGITPAMAIGASYANALAHWSTNRRFLLNLPMFGREQYHPDVEKLVGDFTSSLMLDVDMRDAHTPAARARAMQDVLHATAKHASVSGLDVLRDMSRHRGVQTLAPIVYTSALGLGDLFAGDVTEQFGTPVWTISQGPQVLIDAQATPLTDGLMINWDVRIESFPAGLPQAMFDYHIAELTRLATDDASWDAADPPAVSERSAAVRDALNSTRATPSGDTLADGFFRNAAADPDAIAVVSDEETLSYAQLLDKVHSIAAALQSRGVTKGEVVAVLGPKTAEQIPALLAIHAVGAAYLPIAFDQPADRAARILESGDVEFALFTGTDEGDHRIPSLTVADAELIGDTALFVPVNVEPQDLAYVLFTSGSTGAPKGVEVTHDAAMNTLEFINAHFDIGRADRCLALSTLEGDLSVLDVFGMLAAGGSMVVVDEQHRRDPDHWAELIDRHSVTVLHWMPGWLQMLLDVGAGRLSSVRVVPTGGDWVKPDMVRRLVAEAPGVRFAGLGGATETAIHNTICEITAPPANWTAVPFGIPLPNNACRVVDVNGADCPDWVPGELWVGGRGIARGYRGRPDLTAERFVEYAGRRWYRTGDLVRYLPDGTLEFVGRADHRVKISGYRVELGDVESALQRVPGVVAAVAAVTKATGDRDLLAALVQPVESAVTATDVTTAMADIVPPHMIPQRVVLTDRIPYTVGGKIDRPAVAQALADRGEASERVDRAASTSLERALTALVSDVLGRSDFGVNDDFFALGGDSVQATTLVAAVREWLDTATVMLSDVFATRTVAALADRLAAREPDSDRLEQVAQMYLEVSSMDDAELSANLDTSVRL